MLLDAFERQSTNSIFQKLEESYKKIDDLISLNFSVSDIDNEVKQTRKMASKYDDDFQLMEFEGKMLKKVLVHNLRQ